MMMRTADGPAVVHALDLGPARKPLPRWMLLAVAGSVALHVAGGVWLYQAKFAAPEAITEIDDPLPPISMIDLTPPPPVKKAPTPPKPPTPVHKALNVPVDAPLSPLPAPDKPVTAAVDAAPGYVPPSPVSSPTSTTTAPAVAAPPRVIANPQWVSRPTSAQMARWYPMGALEKEVSGRVVMSCSVTAAGAVTNCAVTSEDPAGYGFGDAAVKLSKYFKMSPRTVDGQPVEGGVVSIPLRFGLR